MKNSQTFITSLCSETAGALLLLAVWWAVTLVYPAYIIPSPWSVLTDVSQYLPSDFLYHAGITLYRTLAGFGLAMILGTLTGVLAVVKNWTRPVNSVMLALQVLPGTILGVIFLLMFGLGSTAPILLVAFLTLPTLAINTVHGLSKKSQKLEQYLCTLQAGKNEMFHYVFLPALVPTLQGNLSLGMGLAVKVVVMGEFIGAQDGLGYLLNNARILLNMKEVFFYLLFLLLGTLLFQAVQSLVFSRFFQKYYYPE